MNRKLIYLSPKIFNIMKTLKSLDLNKFEAVSLSNEQNNSIVGGTHIKTGETAGLDAFTGSGKKKDYLPVGDGGE